MKASKKNTAWVIKLTNVDNAVIHHTIDAYATSIKLDSEVNSNWLDYHRKKDSSLISVWENITNIKSGKASSLLDDDDKELSKYLWKSFKYTVTQEELYDKLKNYEVKYKTTSKIFYKKWLDGKFEENNDTNEWFSLYKSFYSQVD